MAATIHSRTGSGKAQNVAGVVGVWTGRAALNADRWVATDPGPAGVGAD